MTTPPGEPIPGYGGMYRITREGVVWSQAGTGRGWHVMKTKADGSITLRMPSGRRRCHMVRHLVRRAFAPPDQRIPEHLIHSGAESEIEERDECGYAPIPPMADSERWPEAEQRRVVWGRRWGTAVGARAWRWWVVLDGAEKPHLFSPAALAVSPGPEWEATWRAADARRWQQIVAEVRGETRHANRTREALGRAYAGAAEAAR